MLQAFSSWSASLRGVWNWIRAAVRAPLVRTEIEGILSTEPLVFSLAEVEVATGLAVAIQQTAKYIDMLPLDQVIPELAYSEMDYLIPGQFRVTGRLTVWSNAKGAMVNTELVAISDVSLSRNDWEGFLTNLADQYDFDPSVSGFEITGMEYTRS